MAIQKLIKKITSSFSKGKLIKNNEGKLVKRRIVVYTLLIFRLLFGSFRESRPYYTPKKTISNQKLNGVEELKNFKNDSNSSKTIKLGNRIILVRTE